MDCLDLGSQGLRFGFTVCGIGLKVYVQQMRVYDRADDGLDVFWIWVIRV